jgi:hypothetical protein
MIGNGWEEGTDELIAKCACNGFQNRDTGERED